MNDDRRWFNYGLNPLSLLTLRMQLEAKFFMNVKYKVLVVVVEDNLIILHLMLFIFLFIKKRIFLPNNIHSGNICIIGWECDIFNYEKKNT